MTQTSELARVKARIKALTDKTVSNGCTEAEALAAAEMVGKLLERYSLTMAEIDVRETPCVQLTVLSGGQRRRPIDGCVPALARFCDCKVWLTREEQGVAYVFFGFETDTLLARYLFQVIGAAMASGVADFRLRQPELRSVTLRRSLDSFQHGMAARIGERLEAMRQQREAAVATQRSDGTALALVKDHVVEAAFRETETRLVASRAAARPLLGNAFSHGVAAGDAVNLNRPVRHEPSGRLR